MFSKLKQFKDLRDQAKKLQSILGEEKVTVEHRGSTLTMDGNQTVLSVSIAPDLDNAHVNDAVKELVNEAVKKVQRVMAKKLQENGGFEMPKLK
ncbi:MAG: YbaB/EbfC family nucleoid-associated protein [bacterium]|nr:YbaB/EbfC family nucleoid-associated protein [bacterium]